MSAKIYFIKKETKVVANTITEKFSTNDGRSTSGYTILNKTQYDSINNILFDDSLVYLYKWIDNAVVTI